MDHNKLWKILKELGVPDHLTCLLRNLYAGQEATVRIGHGTTAWFQIGKGVCQGCILSPCLFNFYAEYIMLNAGLDKSQGGIKISGRNINDLRFADDTTLMGESKEELKTLDERHGGRASLAVFNLVCAWSCDSCAVLSGVQLFRVTQSWTRLKCFSTHVLPVFCESVYPQDTNSSRFSAFGWGRGGWRKFLFPTIKR